MDRWPSPKVQYSAVQCRGVVKVGIIVCNSILGNFITQDPAGVVSPVSGSRNKSIHHFDCFLYRVTEVVTSDPCIE